MAHDSNANAWINMVKKTKKEYSDGMNEYYLKFVKGKEVPTAGDAANLTKLYNEMKKEADIIQKDVTEMEMTAMSFGGSADAVVGNTKILIETVKKKVPK